MSELLDQDAGIPKAKKIFRFEGGIYLSIAIIVIIGAFGLLIFIAEENRHAPISLTDVIGCSLFLLFLLIGIVTILGQSDIVVDEKSISKRLWGLWTWKTIRWDNIRVIKTSPYYHRALRKMVKLITICPSVRPRFSLSPTGGMGFMDVAVNMNELIEIINHNATKYKINIETSSNGIFTPSTHL